MTPNTDWSKTMKTLLILGSFLIEGLLVAILVGFYNNIRVKQMFGYFGMNNSFFLLLDSWKTNNFVGFLDRTFI